MTNIISGKDLSQRIKSELKSEVAKINAEYNKVPHLVVILVGDNPASISYVKGKEKACLEVGFRNTTIVKDANFTEAELLNLIDELNKDEDVNGILVQLPLPKTINEKKVIERIAVSKDVDGLHPISIGNLLAGNKTLLPCTPKGVITMLKEANIKIAGKHAVVVGRSNLVGKPVAQLLLNENATVTMCHSRTTDLKAFTSQADILVAAVGVPKLITADMVKEGCAVIDVGVNRVDGKLVGDVDYEALLGKVEYLTPVPGGVGPMTITSLLQNTLEAFLNQKA